MRTITTVLLAGAALAAGPPQETRLRWEATGGPGGNALARVVVQQSQILLIGWGRWWRSADEGRRWERLPEPDWPSILAANERDLYADAGNGVRRTSDQGESWMTCGPLPVDPGIGRAVSSLGTDVGRVYVVVSNVGLYSSQDRCATWRQIPLSWKLDIDPFVRYVDGPIVIAGGLRPFISHDAGASWARLDDRLPDSLTFARHWCMPAQRTACSDRRTMAIGGGRSRRLARDGRADRPDRVEEWPAAGRFRGRTLPMGARGLRVACRHPGWGTASGPRLGARAGRAGGRICRDGGWRLRVVRRGRELGAGA